MEFEQINEILNTLENETSVRMKRYIHYRSMRNFVKYFGDIKNPASQKQIIYLLSNYIEEIKGKNFEFDVRSSGDLAKKYLFDLADFYKDELGFMRFYNIQEGVIFGLLIDALLYTMGLLRKVWYIPLTTIGFLFYYGFVAVFRQPRGRVYGMFY